MFHDPFVYLTLFSQTGCTVKVSIYFKKERLSNFQQKLLAKTAEMQ